MTQPDRLDPAVARLVAQAVDQGHPERLKDRSVAASVAALVIGGDRREAAA